MSTNIPSGPEASRPIDNEVPGAASDAVRVASKRRRFSQKRGHTLDTLDTPARLKPRSSQSEEKARRISYAPGTRLEDLHKLQREEATDDDSKPTGDKVLMTGWLRMYKTNRHKTIKTRGHRQHKRFRLTARSLEYDQLFQKVPL